MRHNKKYIDKCRNRGVIGLKTQENQRLKHAMNYRPTTSYPVFELRTHNPRTGIEHYIEIKHEINNGTDRYNVYLDGEKWRNNWSRTRFAKWLFDQIDSVFTGWQ